LSNHLGNIFTVRENASQLAFEAEVSGSQISTEATQPNSVRSSSEDNRIDQDLISPPVNSPSDLREQPQPSSTENPEEIPIADVKECKDQDIRDAYAEHWNNRRTYKDCPWLTGPNQNDFDAEFISWLVSAQGMEICKAKGMCRNAIVKETSFDFATYSWEKYQASVNPGRQSGHTHGIDAMLAHPILKGKYSRDELASAMNLVGLNAHAIAEHLGRSKQEATA